MRILFPGPPTTCNDAQAALSVFWALAWPLLKALGGLRAGLWAIWREHVPRWTQCREALP